MTWDGGSGSNALWSTAGNWNIAGTPAIGDTVVFGTAFTSGTTISLAGDRTAASLVIDSGSAFTVANNILNLSSGDVSRTAASSGNQIISSAITVKAAAAWNINGTGLLEVSGAVDDGNKRYGFTKAGSGTLLLSSTLGTDGTLTVNGGTLILGGDNFGGTQGTQMKGATIVNSGVLNIRNNDALGTTTLGTSVSAGAALQLQNGITVRAGEALTLNGTGVANDGALRNISANNTYSTLITLGSATRINSDSGLLTLDVATGNAIAGTQNLTIGGAGDVTIADPIATFTGTLTKDGAGTLTLNGTNTYTGATTLSAGTLSVGTIGNGSVAGNLGQATNAASNLVFNGGTLRYTGASVSTDRNFTINSGKTATFDITTNNLTVSGASTATNGALTKIGSGVLTLTGANTYSGTTTITAGTLQLGDGTSGKDGTIGNSLSVVNNSALIYNRFGSASYGGVISGTGTVTKSGAGTQTLTGANTYGGTTTISAGTLQLGDGTSGKDGTISNSLSVVNNSALIYNRFGSASYGGVISGTGTVTKSGAGTQTLTGANTYTGATTINGGTLSAGNTGGLQALGGTSSVTVTTGGTLLLESNNQINNAAGINLAGGTFDLNGKSEGSAGVTGAGTLTLTASSTLDFGAPGEGNSLIQFAAIGGATNLGDNIALHINNWQGTPVTGGGLERLLFAGSASAFTTRFAQNEVIFDSTSGYCAVQFGGYYEITAPAGFAAVPEPETIFGGLILLGLVGYRERHRAVAWWASFLEPGLRPALD